MAAQVRLLTLEDGENYQHILYRLQKGKLLFMFLLDNVFVIISFG